MSGSSGGGGVVRTISGLLGLLVTVLLVLFVIGIASRAAPDVTNSVPGYLSAGWATVASWLDGPE